LPQSAKAMPLSAETGSTCSKDESVFPCKELERNAKAIDMVELELLIQQWQLVQHCFSENSDKVDELNTTVETLSSSLEVEQMFSVGLNTGLKTFSESVSRRFDAIDQNIKEQLVIERKVRDGQFEALAQIVREFVEEFQACMVGVVEEGLLREKTAREDSNAQLRKIIEGERAIRRKMERVLVREKEAREQLMRDRIENRVSCAVAKDATIKRSMSVPIPQLYESARELMQLGTVRSGVGTNATLATAVTNPSKTSKDSSSESMDAPSTHRAGSSLPCTLQLQSGPNFTRGGSINGDSLTANGGNTARLTGTW